MCVCQQKINTWDVCVSYLICQLNHEITIIKFVIVQKITGS